MTNEQKIIYGRDAGTLDVERANELTELELYEQIEALGGLIWRINHDLADGRIKGDDESTGLNGLRIHQQYLLQLTRKFGVEIDEPSENPVHPTASYWCWYEHWNDHFKKMDDGTYSAFMAVRKAGLAIDTYLPQGDWKANIPAKQKYLDEAEELWKRLNKPAEGE